MSEKSLVVSVKGVALYPKKEDGVLTYAIRIAKETADKLNSMSMASVGHMLSIHDEEDDNGVPTGSKLLNVSTKFVVPVYDENNNGTEMKDVRIYHGAEVIVGICVKEWSYKGKTGAHAYLTSFGLIKNGEAKETGSSYKSLKGNLI